LVGLVAYTGEIPVPILLRRARQPGATDQRPPHAPPLVPRSNMSTSTNERLELSQ
jgi:hypothetical protein